MKIAEKHAATWTDLWGKKHDVFDGYPTEEGYVPRFSKVCQTVVAKYALIGWAARTERNRIVDILALEPQSWAQVRGALIQRNGAYKSTGEPKLTHEVIRDEAGATGTAAHAWMEWWVSGQQGPEPAVEGGAEIVQRVMRPWLAAAAIRATFVEEAVYVLKGEIPAATGMGGRLDWAGEVDREVTDWRGSQGRVSGFVMGDWKTGSGVYLDHLLQVAFYAKALSVRHGTPFPCPGLIVHPPKTEADCRKWKGAPELYLFSPERMARAWIGVRAMLNLYEMIQEGV